MSSLLYKMKYKITDGIEMKIPLVGEVIDGGDDYYETVSLIVSTPSDMMVQLDNAGVDFTTISDWGLFCLMFGGLGSRDTSLIFEDVALKDFCFVHNEAGSVVLQNPKTGVVIDAKVHAQICAFLRKILRIEKNTKKPANDEAKKYLIERARKKLARRKRRGQQAENSPLENYIISLVNTSEFPYDFNTVRDITIYQFNASLEQVINKVRFDKLMIGCYAGTVDTEKLDKKELSWIMS